ncbi:MAG: hypothetical protein IH991_14385 [Planctomycetes bacterium]|nr:hypothetical protein [Planctomycetota bacterium]
MNVKRTGRRNAHSTHRILVTALLVFIASVPAARAADTAAFDKSWKQHVDLRVKEPIGLARQREAVEFEIEIGKVDPSRFAKELRVVDLDTGKEVLAQGHSVQSGRATIVFLASVAAGAERAYRVYFDNPGAKPAVHKTDLRAAAVTGMVEVKPRRKFALSISNDHLRADLHPQSGQIARLTYLKGTGDVRTFIGNAQTSILHWNPDLRNRSRLFEVPPPLRGKRAWEYVHYWDPPPKSEVEIGPLMVRVRRSGPFAHTPEVDCEVTYTFFADQPYFVVDTRLEILKDYEVEFLRDDEFGFKFGYNRALWKLKSGTVKGWDLTKLLEPGTPVHGVPTAVRGIIPFEPDCPWITFYHDKTAEAVAVIHTKYENGAVGKVKMEPPESFIHVKGPAYNYWGRVLAGKLHKLPQVKLPKGMRWETQSVILFYKYDGKGQPDTLHRYEKLLCNPLKVEIVTDR